MLTKKEILARLRRLRMDMELRQEFMARSLGIDRTTYVRKESGGIPITTEEWLKLAEVMEKDPSYFFRCQMSVEEGLPVEDREALLVRLYRTLTPEERDEFICGIHLMLKGIRRRAVRETVERLRRV
ncbi:MAG: helix-turn-helix domain-containing protein [Thermodesulfobacteriota bacterium]